MAYDLHPRYLSTRYAMAMEGVRKIGIQHHHAHIASCMAENRLEGSVIGVALDGTGYGTDGKIWGGELLVCDFSGFERAYHFRYVPLAGGDAAVRQPWRSALAYAKDAGLDAEFLRERIAPDSLQVADRMIVRGVNTVDSSSCGRLFDAVSALLGLRLEANYEGQAAMELEAAAHDVDKPYPFEINGGEVDLRETIRSVARDRQRPGIASGRFHLTLAHVVTEGARRMRAADHLNRVCLSGGSFQNLLLLRQTIELLQSEGFEVYTHALVPPNDGGLSLGQAVCANRMLLSL